MPKCLKDKHNWSIEELLKIISQLEKENEYLKKGLKEALQRLAHLVNKDDLLIQ